MCVRAGDTLRLFFLLLPHLASPSHGGTRPRVCDGDGRGRRDMENRGLASVRPSAGTAGRGRGRCPPVGPAGSAREEDGFGFSLFSRGDQVGGPWTTGSAAGRWVACRNPAVIRDWGDPWPVASARGIRSPSQEILGSARLLCIPHDCFSHTLGPLGEAGRGKAEPDPGQLMGSGYFHFWRGCCRWMVFVVLVGAVASHWPVDEAWCLVLFGLAVGAGGRSCPRLWSK